MKRSRIIALIFVVIALGLVGLISYRFFYIKKIRSNTIERTLAIIKPDAVRAKNTGKIIDRIEQEGFTVIDLKKVTLDREPAEQLYQKDKNKSFFSGVIDFMTSGPVVALILEKVNAIADFADLVGNVDPRKAGDRTLRRQFGTDIRHNGVHGSDSPENAQREIKLFFADRFKM